MYTVSLHKQDIHSFFSFDTVKQQMLVLPLFENAAQKYQRRKQPLDLIFHLLQLDAPFLFIPHTPFPDSMGLKRTALAREAFHLFLVDYIHINCLAGSIRQRVAELMVSYRRYYICIIH